jgi:hypothetical protein
MGGTKKKSLASMEKEQEAKDSEEAAILVFEPVP